MARPSHETLLVADDPDRSWSVVVALHSTARGPAFGGIRRQAYASIDAAIDDAARLAEAMTIKCALSGLPAGGGKTVLCVHDPRRFDREAAYLAVGELVESLDGRYVCGPDVGTGPHELALVARATSYVNPANNDAGASTAAGVLAGLATIWDALGYSNARGRRVVVQGLGAVGLTVARRLLSAGAEVIGADTDAAACARAAASGVQLVDPTGVMAQACDVLMPCAMGQILDARSIALLRCAAVCGSANNQLADLSAATLLHHRGILHAPDEVVSAGAVIEGVLTVRDGQGADSRARVHATIAAIGDVLAAVLRAAKAQDCAPSIVARQRGLALTAGASPPAG